jgi:predicted small secreted protein
MTRRRRGGPAHTGRVVAVLVTVVLAAATLSGCRTTQEAAGDDTEPVTLQAVEGTDRYQVTLTPDAVERLGLRTDTVHPVTAANAGSPAGARSSVPYAAVVYDADGSTWAYTVVENETYARAALTVASVAGDTAYLTSGPPVGTPVVVVGAPELLGAEYQIAGEE